MPEIRTDSKPFRDRVLPESERKEVFTDILSEAAITGAARAVFKMAITDTFNPRSSCKREK